MKIIFTIILYYCFIAINIQRSSAQQNLQPIFQWTEAEFGFPTTAIEQTAINTKNYVRGNAVIIDADVDYKGGSARYFVTTPRFTTGIPLTLGTISGYYKNGNPIINGYPDYYSQNRNDCSGIISVFRIAIDECRRLWVLDTGAIGSKQICHPQLLAFNLANDALLYRYPFPSAQYKPGVSLFITPVVDVRDTCANTMVYIADVTGFAIVVFDLYKFKSWRVQHPLTQAQQQYSNFTIAGESFTLADGIFGMALTPKNLATYQNRYLYFHALASITENRVPLSILDDCATWEKNINACPTYFVQIGSRGTQCSAQAMDCYGNLYQGLTSPTAISCWDSRTAYVTQNMRIAAYNYQTLQFTSGMKIIKNIYNQEELWAVTCRFQKIMRGTKNSNEVNYRIQAIKINDLLGGYTQCNGAPFSSYVFPIFK